MQTVPRFPIILILTALCFSLFTGCYSMPYGYYGRQPYGNNPAYPYPAPGPMYAPQMMPGQQFPTPLNVPSGDPNGFGSPTPTWTPGGGGNAPMFTPNSNGAVPDPIEPNDGGVPFNKPPTSSRTFRDNQNGKTAEPFDPSTSVKSQSIPVAQAIYQGAGIQPASHEARATLKQPSPYDYDRQSMSWLRGVAQFDASTQRFRLVYASPAEPNDPFGGSLPLENHVQLAKVQPGDVVYVEGSLRSGEGQNQTYLPTTVLRLTPRE